MRPMLPLDFRSVVDASRDGVVVLDSEGRYLYANPAAVRLTSTPLELMLGRSYLELWPVLAQGPFDEAFRRVAAGGPRETLESRSILLPDAWVRHDLSVVAPGLVRVTWYEITDRKNLETARSRSAEHLALAVEAAQLGLFEYEVASGAVHSSERFNAILGLPPSTKLTLELCFELCHADDRAQVQAALDRTALGEAGFQIECRMRAGDVERWVRAIGRGLYEEGKLVRVIGTAADVTAAKARARMQRFLATAGEALNSSLDLAPTLETVARLAIRVLGDSCIIDLLEGGVLRRAEMAFAEEVGNLESRVRGVLVDKHPPNHPVMQALAGRSVLIPGYTDQTARETAANPEHLEIIRAVQVRSLLSVPLMARGQVLGVITFLWRQPGRHHTADDQALAEELGRRMALAIDNASHHQQLQAALRDREELIVELQRALRLSDLFLGILGHDLRNPLAAIVTGAQAIQLRADESTARTAARIRSSGLRMGRMIEDLLDFTRIRVGKGVTLQPREADLHSLCRETVEELREANPSRTIDCVAEGDCKGVWDPDRVAQVVSNLVGNALQHGEQGSTVTVRLDGREAAVVHVRVHNHGRPIPEEARAGLFDPFKRAVGTRDGGLGLGLFISDQIARLHGGRLDVASSERDGTTFTLSLPRGG